MDLVPNQHHRAREVGMTATTATGIPLRQEPHENRDGSRSSGLGRGAHGFWNKVHKRDDGCWDWTGFLDRDGAGKFCTGIDGRQRYFRAPRYAWEQLVGPVPAGHILLAIVCWNSKCVNPTHREAVPATHLKAWTIAVGRQGDQADNRGELCGRAILKSDDVYFIRAQPRVLGVNRLLARLYGVSVFTINGLRRRRRYNWRHLPERRTGIETMSLRLLRELVEQRERDRAQTRISEADAEARHG